MAEWDAEVAVDGSLVRALLGEQFPELDASSARFLGDGWDNSAWVVEDEWAFRFPRREVAIPGVRRELEVLPRLAPVLRGWIPEPLFVGAPSDRFPWPFFGSRLLPGVEPAQADLDDGARLELGAALGRLLRELHRADTLDLVDPDTALPVDFNHRADMAVRLPRARENLAALETLRLWRAPAGIEAIFASAEKLPATQSELKLAHGDLHQRHVLVDGAALTAIIDWGDVCRADPCIDLVPYWSLLTAAGRERFLVEYGEVTDEQLLRARVLAIGLDSMLARYAHDVGNARLKRGTIAALERTLVDFD